MTIKQIMLGLSALALSASLTPAAYAATDTGTLTIKAHIGAGCTLKTPNATLDFGNLTSTGDADHNAETSITVQCSSGQPYNIELGRGQNWSDRGGLRQMKNGTYLLDYYLTQDAAHTIFWDNANSSVSKPKLSATGDGNDQKHMIYGLISKGTRAAPSGDYVDTVVITVGY